MPERPDDRRGRLAAADDARRRWSSSTTRPTSSATWPRHSPSSFPAVVEDEDADEDADDRGRRTPRTSRGRRRRAADDEDEAAADEPTSHALKREAARRGAARDPRVPARAVAADVSRAVAGDSAPARPVRPRPDARLLGPRPAPAVQRSTRSTASRAESRSTSGSPASAPRGWRGCSRATAAEMLGPLGRPFEVDPKTRHMLLVAGGLGMAGVRSLADEALAAGRQVTGAVRRRDGARGLPVVAAARRGGVRRLDRRRQLRPRTAG